MADMNHTTTVQLLVECQVSLDEDGDIDAFEAEEAARDAVSECLLRGVENGFHHRHADKMSIEIGHTSTPPKDIRFGKTTEAVKCKRCDLEMMDGLCRDETCHFSSYKRKTEAEADKALLEQALKQLDMLGQPLLDECGCCGGYHRAVFCGDCRDDTERYSGPYGERN